MKKLILSGLMLTLLSACGSDPIVSTHVTEHRPTIIIRNAPVNSTFTVDGINIGKVQKNKSTLVEAGKHVVRVYSPSGSLLHTEKVFVSGAVLREIKLPELQVQ